MPRITVVAARVPPVTFWNLESPWPGLLIWASIVPSIGGLIALGILDKSLCYWPIVYLFLSVFVISGLYVFSGTVTNNKLNQIIRFCYVFTGFALAGSLLPFALPGLFSNLDISSKAPLGILRMCQSQQTNLPNGSSMRAAASMGCDWWHRGGGARRQFTPASTPPPAAGTPRRPSPSRCVGRNQWRLRNCRYTSCLGYSAVISMTRRSEYQRRALDSQDAHQPEARENWSSDRRWPTAPLTVCHYIIFRIHP